MLREFRDFLLRGNIVELAVAFVMGLAFAAVVNSLVNDPAIAGAVFFFVVKPVNALLDRYRSAEEGMPDEERRHQEPLAALRGVSAPSAG
jgi:large-conductance mechanosensitive channel